MARNLGLMNLGGAVLTAVERGDHAALKNLLKAGAPVTARNAARATALLLAVRKRDAEAVKGVRLSRATVRRVMGFARPFRRTITVFLVAVFVSAVLGLAPPLLFRAILDTAIPRGDRGLITVLAAFVVAAFDRGQYCPSWIPWA